jgi:aryl-alcohol dehydrogenase-like predicted oxidoreductase
MDFDFPPVEKDRYAACLEVLQRIAQDRGVSAAQISIAWLLAQRYVTSVIVGAKRAEQLADNIGAAAVRLTGDELELLNSVSALPAEYPEWMIRRQAAYRKVKAS